MEKYILNSFILKFGKNSYNNLLILIKNELKNNGYYFQLEDMYIAYIFEIAIFKNCNINNSKIPIIIKGMGNYYNPPIQFNKLLKIHHTSINIIKQYLQ